MVVGSTGILGTVATRFRLAARIAMFTVRTQNTERTQAKL